MENKPNYTFLYFRARALLTNGIRKLYTVLLKAPKILSRFFPLNFLTELQKKQNHREVGNNGIEPLTFSV